jgi:hypothetical protein
MIFLDDPPPGIRDRWKQGAKMCSAWGIPCTGPSVWRLYRSQVLEWRLRLAAEAYAEASADTTGPGASFEERMAQMVARRTFEILANPHSAPASLVGLARIELRKNALELRQATLELARQKHYDDRIKKLELALDSLADELRANPEARAAFLKVRDLLLPEQEKAEPPDWPYPPGPTV